MTSKTRVLCGFLILGAIAGLATSAAYAAADNPAVSVTSQATAFDPFTLKTYAIQRTSARTSLRISTSVAPRIPIRIPFRPVLRSPFRPDLGSRAW